MPRLAISMTEGVLTEWLVADGATVVAGTTLYILETDKVENEVDAPAAGTITLVAEPGQTYPVGTILALIE